PPLPLVFILKKNPTECVIHLWFSPDSKGSLYVMATILQSDDLDIARVYNSGRSCQSAAIGMFNVRAQKCVRHQSTYSRNVGIYSIVDVNLHARPQFSRINSCACASQWPVQQDSVGLITHLGNHAGTYRSLCLVR
ncbi:hypothetical protein T310_9858, partial [Rasamsonia emersonii CBS 393.64]